MTGRTGTARPTVVVRPFGEDDWPQASALLRASGGYVGLHVVHLDLTG